MRIGYTTAASTPTAIALSAGMWLTLDAGAGCIDRSPASKSRLLWRDDATPAIGHYVDLLLTLTAASPIGVCAFLGVDLPVGTVVHVYGKRAADAGATYDFVGQNTATIVEFANGTRGAWFVLPAAADPVEQVAFRIYNNRGGATWADPETTIDIGELVAMPVVETPIRDGWTLEDIDPTEFSRTRSAQVAGVSRTAYRRLSGQLVPQATAMVRGQGMANSMDWGRLSAALRGGARCCAIPQYKTAGVIDAALLHSTALYGVCTKLPSISSLQRGYFAGDFAFEEVPAT